MKNLAYLFLALVLAEMAAGPALAQQRGAMTHLGRGVNPGMSLSAPATTPLQEQMQDDYATQLRATQRDLLQQNPSGLTRQELAIRRELNGFTAR